jgi:hypothetical protein
MRPDDRPWTRITESCPPDNAKVLVRTVFGIERVATYLADARRWEDELGQRWPLDLYPYWFSDGHA